MIPFDNDELTLLFHHQFSKVKDEVAKQQELLSTESRVVMPKKSIVRFSQLSDQDVPPAEDYEIVRIARPSHLED